MTTAGTSDCIDYAMQAKREGREAATLLQRLAREYRDMTQDAQAERLTQAKATFQAAIESIEIAQQMLAGDWS